MNQETITKLLELFVGGPKYGRLICEKPFRGCGLVCATDLYTVVMIDESEVADAEQYPLRERDAKHIAKIPADYTRRLSLAAIKDALSKVPLVEETVYESEECKECDCMGTVEWEYRDSEGNYHYDDFDCPVCDGRGYFGERRYKTGRMISDPKATFRWGALFLRADILNKLRQAMEIAGVESAPVTLHAGVSSKSLAEVILLTEHVRVTFAPMVAPFGESVNLEIEKL